MIHSYTIPLKPQQRRLSLLRSSSGSDYNVVLRPSYDQEDAFDNFKVGNCRVHRYSPDTTGSSSSSDSSTTEYVMWYHGRNHALETRPNKNDTTTDTTAATATTTTTAPLPPLSTGRIGRATSRNGLVWEKDLIGSQSEDTTGVALGLNQESWWSFDTSHVGLGSVLLPLATPAVLSADGVYLMYYMGGNHEETSVRDYMNLNDESTLATVSPAVLDSKLRGMTMKIGVALSQDGVSWGRVEGDDPSGACMVPYSSSDPNQKQQSSSSTNSKTNLPEELYCAWPEVIVNETPNSPGEAFVMYYSTMTKETKQKIIAYAVSEDGFRWFKRGPCIMPTTSDPENHDGNGCSRCCVYQDATYNVDTRQWVTNTPNTWTMYYEGTSSHDNKHRICVAKSSNGLQWEKINNGHNMALDIGAPNTWDCQGVGSPHCIRYVHDKNGKRARVIFCPLAAQFAVCFYCSNDYLDWMMARFECTTPDKVSMVVLPLVWRNYCLMTKMLYGSANNRPSHSQQLPIEERQYDKESGRTYIYINLFII